MSGSACRSPLPAQLAGRRVVWGEPGGAGRGSAISCTCIMLAPSAGALAQHGLRVAGRLQRGGARTVLPVSKRSVQELWTL